MVLNSMKMKGICGNILSKKRLNAKGRIMIRASIAFEDTPKDKWEVLEAWQEGKDFIILEYPSWWIGGRYFSGRDAQAFRENNENMLKVATIEDGIINILI